MNHKKANDLLEDLRLYAAAIIHNDYDVDTQEFIPNTYYGFEAEVSNDANPSLSIDVLEIEEEVCVLVYEKSHTTYQIKINDVLDGECSFEKQNKMTFMFDAQTFEEDVCGDVEIRLCYKGTDSV